jgi:hypothetical protein
MQYPILKDAKDALDQLSEDPEARERAERREIELKLHQYGVGLLRADKGRQMLTRLLSVKFGSLTPDVLNRIAGATEETIDVWAERIISAETLDAVFQS